MVTVDSLGRKTSRRLDRVPERPPAHRLSGREVATCLLILGAQNGVASRIRISARRVSPNEVEDLDDLVDRDLAELHGGHYHLTVEGLRALEAHQSIQWLRVGDSG